MEQKGNTDGKGKGYIALTLTSTLWGTTWVASKIGITEMPVLQMAALRQMIAGAFFIIFFMLVKKLPLPTKKQWKWLFIMAILMFVLANGLSTWSLKYIPTGLSALIGALYPLSVVVIERIFYKAKRITPLTLLGFILGIAGIGIVFYENVFDNVSPSFAIGLILSVIAMLSWSLGTVFIARNKAQLNPYYATGWQMMLSALILFVISVTAQDTLPVKDIPLKGWLVIFYLVIFGSIITFVSFIYSMKKLPAAIASLYAYFNPLIAIVTAAIVLNEKLTMNILWGAIVTVIGVFLVNYSIKRNNDKILTEPEI
jgi:drug/metabolite transporter (DMT)-like permease